MDTKIRQDYERHNDDDGGDDDMAFKTYPVQSHMRSAIPAADASHGMHGTANPDGMYAGLHRNAKDAVATSHTTNPAISNAYGVSYVKAHPSMMDDAMMATK